MFFLHPVVQLMKKKIKKREEEERKGDEKNLEFLKTSIADTWDLRFSRIVSLPYRVFVHTWFNTFRSAS